MGDPPPSTPSNPARNRLSGIVFLVVSGLFLLASLPCLLGAALGMLGVLADVSGPENRQMGIQLFLYAAILLGLCLLSLLIGLALLIKGRKKTKQRGEQQRPA